MATLKQKKAFQEAGVNGGIISKAMRKAGYSESVSKRTDKLTNTKGWAELMEQYIPDKDLAIVHRKLLHKSAIRLKNNVSTGEVDVIETGEVDVQAASKALDMAYKLKGKYSSEKIDLNVVRPELKQEANDVITKYLTRNSKQ